MNISLFVYSKTNRSIQVIDHISDSVIRYWLAVGLIHDRTRLTHSRIGRAALLNTNTTSQAWRPHPSNGLGDRAASFTAPPIPVAHQAHIDIYADFFNRLNNPRSFRGLLPPFFAAFALPGCSGVVTDYLGHGRAYFLENEHFYVASNHIGSCLFFSPPPISVDSDAWKLFSGFGWFVGDTSPFQAVRRLPAATLVTFDEQGHKSQSTYYGTQELFGLGDERVDVETITSEMQQAARNISTLSTSLPVVHLSGGRDSRVTTAATLSSGADCFVLTIGTIDKEVQIAAELMRLVDTSAAHSISVPNAGDISQSFDERAQHCMALWDGDMNPNRLKRATVPGQPDTQVTITGGGGEIAHGNYYATERMFELVRTLERPTDRLARAFGDSLGVTAGAKRLILEYLDHVHDRLHALGLRGPSILDGFYLIERTRRWVAAGHLTCSPLLYGTIAFVRGAMQLTPDERYADVLHRRLLERLVPAWSAVPFFKASPTDVDDAARRGLRIWQGQHRDEFFERLIEAANDPFWDGVNILGAAVNVLRNNAEVRMESTFQKVLWRQAFLSHYGRLESAIEGCWHRIRANA